MELKLQKTAILVNQQTPNFKMALSAPTTIHRKTDPKKVLQIRYRNPRGCIELFWAQDAAPFGSLTQFSGCKMMRAHRGSSGIMKNYAHELQPIAIPSTLAPTILTVDQPEWWERTRFEAEVIVKNLETNATTRELGKHIHQHAESLAGFLGELNATDQMRMVQQLSEKGKPFEQNAQTDE